MKQLFVAYETNNSDWSCKRLGTGSDPFLLLNKYGCRSQPKGVEVRLIQDGPPDMKARQIRWEEEFEPNPYALIGETPAHKRQRKGLAQGAKSKRPINKMVPRDTIGTRRWPKGPFKKK